MAGKKSIVVYSVHYHLTLNEMKGFLRNDYIECNKLANFLWARSPTKSISLRNAICVILGMTTLYCNYLANFYGPNLQQL